MARRPRMPAQRAYRQPWSQRAWDLLIEATVVVTASVIAALIVAHV